MVERDRRWFRWALTETDYRLGQRFGLTLAVTADIHFRKCGELLAILERRRPDVILIPGDLVDGDWLQNTCRYDESMAEALEWLNRLSEIAPTYFSLGNHEKHFPESRLGEFAQSKAVVLREGFTVCREGLLIGGMTSGVDYRCENRYQPPNPAFLAEFEQAEGYRLLLCHHPEYYAKYIKDKRIDLVISGHAHGGQVRLLGQGLYAPGQGVFPRYTSGLYDGRLLVSRGIGETETVPRINNRPEVLFVEI